MQEQDGLSVRVAPGDHMHAVAVECDDVSLGRRRETTVKLGVGIRGDRHGDPTCPRRAPGELHAHAERRPRWREREPEQLIPAWWGHDRTLVRRVNLS